MFFMQITFLHTIFQIMRWWFLIFLCFLLLLLCDSVNFNRTFKLKRQKKPARDRKNKNGTSIFKKGLKKFLNISHVPTLPPIPTLSPRKIIINKENEGYNPCEVINLCANNGKCQTKLNEYYCECKPEYYGKTCHFYADQSYCENHKCQNDGTCYSIDKPIVVQNPKFYDESHDSSAVLKELTVEIRYQCWCKFGFFGTFCEFSEEMQHCVEESCSGHGIIKPGSKTFKCECQCEENYSGDKCERVSPCRDLECTNYGKCIESVENGEAKCECPKSNEINLIEAEIKGEVCEIIHVDDSKITPEKCLPCSGDFHKWIKCLKDHHRFFAQDLEFLLKNCDSECQQKLQGNDCLHDGNCSVVVDKFPISRFQNKLFLVPKCYCPENYRGDFCQHLYNTSEPCETANFNCNNGTCEFNEEKGLHCTCDYGMKGTTCEIKDPCVPNPCNNTICVEIPDGTNLPKFSCICGLNQDVDPDTMHCITPHHTICTTASGEPTCKNNGHCYPCVLDKEDEKLSLCNEDESKRGFRCICPPGFMPPFCEHEVTACSFHKCQNGGKCIPKNGTLADYDCKCKPDYNGTFCEQTPNICKAEGFLACVHGSCEENSKSGRGFSCKCKEGYVGYNCHLKKEWDFFTEVDKRYWWTYPLLLSILLFPFTLVILWLKRRHRLAKAAAEAADLEASKTKPESVTQTNVENLENNPEQIPNVTVKDDANSIPMIVQSGESADDKNKSVLQPQQSVESGKVNNNRTSEETQKKAKSAEAQPTPVDAATPNETKTSEKPTKKNRKLRKK